MQPTSGAGLYICVEGSWVGRPIAALTHYPPGHLTT